MTAELPARISALVDPRACFTQLQRRTGPDWRRDVIRVVRHPQGIGVDPAPLLREASLDRLRESLAPVARRGAEDLLKLILSGSLFHGLDAQLIESDLVLARSIQEVLDSFGPGVEYFTNHGHAEDGEEAQFLVTGFHFNSLAVTLYDICLIAVDSDRILVAWRFEDA
ncbi:hypothetical protein ACFV98_41365 [Streptomyces violascens]|uniref:hypothetical protein n=1 Tax=Streptomyces violascens TaxID=67381 RepID=UPI0036522B4F